MTRERAIREALERHGALDADAILVIAADEPDLLATLAADEPHPLTRELTAGREGLVVVTDAPRPALLAEARVVVLVDRSAADVARVLEGAPPFCRIFLVGNDFGTLTNVDLHHTIHRQNLELIRLR